MRRNNLKKNLSRIAQVKTASAEMKARWAYAERQLKFDIQDREIEKEFWVQFNEKMRARFIRNLGIFLAVIAVLGSVILINNGIYLY